MRRVYLDNAATTYLSQEVINEMTPAFNVMYGNSNSIHSFGREAIALVDRARDRVAKAIGANSNEIYFTSSSLMVEISLFLSSTWTHSLNARPNHLSTSSIDIVFLYSSVRLPILPNVWM